MRSALALLVVVVLTAGAEAGEPILEAASYAAVRDHVVPSEAEMRWRDLGWRPTLWDAVLEAQAKERPILLWTMNGHPLCNT